MQYSVSVLPLASLCGVESMDSDYRLGAEMYDGCTPVWQRTALLCWLSQLGEVVVRDLGRLAGGLADCSGEYDAPSVVPTDR